MADAFLAEEMDELFIDPDLKDEHGRWMDIIKMVLK